MTATRSTPEASASDSAFEQELNRELERRVPTQWLVWRRRLLVVVGLLGGVGLFLWMGWLARAPFVDLRLGINSDANVVLLQHGDNVLGPHTGALVRRLVAVDGSTLVLSEAALERSPRWIVDPAARANAETAQAWITRAVAAGPLVLELAEGQRLQVQAGPRGFAHLGWMLWPLAVLALVLWLVGTALLLLGWRRRNLLYLAMAVAQGCNLLAAAVQSMPGLGLPGAWPGLDFPLRASLDLITAAAVLHTSVPERMRGQNRIGVAIWALAGALVLALWQLPLPGVWWVAQAAIFALSLGALVVLSLAYRKEPNPFMLLVRRFGVAAVGSLFLLCAVAVAARWLPALQSGAAHAGALMWTLFFASLLLLLPFMSRSRQAMREFALLAGVSTVATSLDLLFVAVFSFGQFTSLTLAVFLALAVYSAARQWILNQMTGSRVLTVERTFEQLYRVAREVEQHPQRLPVLLAQLMRELFEPLEVLRVSRSSSRALVLGDGSALIVPLSAAADSAGHSLVLRFAQRGKRIFTLEDARLTDRVVEQLRRAVAYDKAVEQGRTEERLRIAQDLHDDIGARLLTLMYQAQSPEMEDYVRHTLQDLKTLTRGLATAEHRFSHASAEWKADLTQRLAAAQVELHWSMQWDRDPRLSVVQWSALTRVLRELVTNIIAHGRATQVEVHGQLLNGALSLRVADNGVGRRPETWSHGLGLGGVRKRVKQLGGQVQWDEAVPSGIVCAVQIPSLGNAPAAA